MNKLLIIDQMNLAHRAFYVYPPLTANGQSTQIPFGFMNMILNLLRFDSNITSVAIAQESRTPTWRKQYFVEYKAKRKTADPDMIGQLPLVDKMLEAVGWPTYRVDGYEADDVLATLAVKAAKIFDHVYIATNDQDLYSIVSEKITVISTKGEQINLVTPQFISDKYSLRIDQMVDRKALVGDSSDGYPGCPGIGPVKADALLRTYDNIEGIYAALDEVKPDGVRLKLKTGRDMVQTCRALARLDTMLNIEPPVIENVEALNNDNFMALLNELEMKQIISQIKKLLAVRAANTGVTIAEVTPAPSVLPKDLSVDGEELF